MTYLLSIATGCIFDVKSSISALGPEHFFLDSFPYNYDDNDEDDCGASDAKRGVGDIFVLPWVSPVISGSPTFENCLGE